MSLRTFNYQYPYNEFWLLIEEAQGSRERFHKLIEPFSYEELRAYQDEFFRVKFWTDAHRAVIEHIDPYGSPVDTRLFVISQGYDYYQKLSKNPNQLPAGIRADHPQILYYTIARVIETKYKDRFFDYKDPSNRFWQLIERAQGSQKKLYKLIESLTYDELSMYRRQFFKAQDYLWSKDYPEELKLRKTSFNNFFTIHFAML
ncbi:MAG: hypothetical protein HC880_00620 [Bacteroidia bacterium]|nr:hypothetical protein [Bacteroidia bacterium]